MSSTDKEIVVKKSIFTKKRVLIASSIFIVMLAGVPLLVYSILKSSDVQKRILTSLKEPLAKAGVTAEFSEFSIDLLAGVNFDHLVLAVHRPPLIDAALTIEHVRFGYSFWSLLKKHLVLQEAEIRGFRGQIEASLPAPVETKEEPPMKLAQILEMLRTPPVEISIPSISIKDTSIKLKLTQGLNRTNVDLKQADVQISATVKPGTIDVDLTSSVALAVDMSSEAQQATPTKKQDQTPMAGSGTSSSHIKIADLRLHPVVKFHVDAPSGHLNWRLDMNADPLKMDGVSVESNDHQGQDMRLALTSLSLSPEIHVERSGPISDNDPLSAVAAGMQGGGAQKVALHQFTLTQNNKASGEHLEASLEKLRLSNELSFGLDKETRDIKPENLKWSLSHLTQLTGLHAKTSVQPPKGLAHHATPPKKPLAVTIASVNVAADSKANHGPGELTLHLTLGQIKTDILASALSVDQSAQITFNLLEKTWQNKIDIKLNNASVLSIKGSGQDQKGTLADETTINLSIPKSLLSVHKDVAALDAAGWPEVSLKVTNAIHHSLAWSEFRGELWPALGIHSEIDANISPTTKKFPEGSPTFTGVHAKVNVELPARPMGRKDSTLHSDIQLDVDHLGHPALKHPVAAELDTKLNVNISDRISGNIKMDTIVDKMRVLTLDTSWKDEPKILGLDNKLIAEITPKFLALLKAAETAPPMGILRLQGHHQIKINHGQAKLLAIKKLDPNKTKIEAQLSDTIEQDANGVEKLKAKLERPFNFTAGVILDNGQIKLLGKISAPKIVIPETLAVNGLAVDLKAFVSDLTEMKAITFNADGGAGNIELLVKDTDAAQSKAQQSKAAGLAKSEKVLRNLRFAVAARVENKIKILIDRLEAGLQDELFKFSGQGEFYASGRGQLDAKITSKLSQNTQILSGSGQFDMPIKLILLDKNRFSLESTPTFKNYSLVFGDLALKNLNGSVSITEELRQDEQSKIRFLYLRSQNPFARVDYENLDPFVGDRALLSFDLLTWKHIGVGPLVASLEIQQNLILLNDLKVDLLGGSALGRFFLDLNPQAPKIGILGRFSGIQPEQIKPPERRLPKSEWAAMAGRTAINFDLRKRLATGRIDLTTIGKRQLLSLIDVLDPDYKDDQLAMARQGLRLAYPKFMNISLDQGMMDFTVGLGGVVSEDIQIRSLPLSGLINSNAGDAISKIESFLN
jgi:hypothetical protein